MPILFRLKGWADETQVVQRNLLDKMESSSSANPDQLHHVHIVLHEDCYSKLEEVKNKLVQKAGINANNISVESSHIKAHLKPDQIAAIAKLDEVRSIEQVHKKVRLSRRRFQP